MDAGHISIFFFLFLFPAFFKGKHDSRGQKLIDSAREFILGSCVCVCVCMCVCVCVCAGNWAQREKRGVKRKEGLLLFSSFFVLQLVGATKGREADLHTKGKGRGVSLGRNSTRFSHPPLFRKYLLVTDRNIRNPRRDISEKQRVSELKWEKGHILKYVPHQRGRGVMEKQTK